MKIAFVRKGFEDLGIESLSSYVKQRGHKVELFFDGSIFSSNFGINNDLLSQFFDISDKQFEHRLVQRFKADKPDLVGFGGPSLSYQWSLYWARFVKKNFGLPVIFGGPHATCAPDTVLSEDCVDAVVLGEGEGALLDLMGSLEDGRFVNTAIPNVWFKNGGDLIKNPVRGYIRDLDSLPFPDKDLFNDKINFFYKFYISMTSRGCPFKCTYCINWIFKELYSAEKNHIRRHSPEYVVEELKLSQRKHKINHVFFMDDVFAINPSWLEQFAPLYRKEIGIPFLCYGYPTTVTERIADALVEAGCLQVRLGIQSWNDETRRKVLNRHYSDEKIFQAGAILKSRGIELVLDHIFLLPGETEAHAARVVEQCLKIQPLSTSNYVMSYFPGNKIIDYAIEKGELGESDRELINQGRLPAEVHKSLPEVTEKNPRNIKYQYYLDLIPLLPAGVMRWLFNNRLLHLLPHSFFLRQFITLLADIKNKNIRWKYTFWLITAKKKMP